MTTEKNMDKNRPGMPDHTITGISTADRGKAAQIVSHLTLADRVRIGVGADVSRTFALPEQGVPLLTLSDGPSGLRYQKPGTPVGDTSASVYTASFPSLASLAATWDISLAQRMGHALGCEARKIGVDVILGPGMNIKRSPLCGRNFEYFSEDPLLTGSLAAAYVKGVQETGTGACIKHFAAYSQEYKRFSTDSLIDERTIHEIYLRAFEMVVRTAHPEMVMSAYPMVNGIYCSDNTSLLRRTLRDKWGYKGVIVTDWGGMHDRSSGYRASCDLAMPGPADHLITDTIRDVKSGRLPEHFVDESACRLVALALKHNRVRQEAGSDKEKYSDIVSSARLIARQVAEEGQVLLKNDGTLPLAHSGSVALIGEMADHPRYQGGGSSHVMPQKLTSLHHLRPQWAYARGYNAHDGSTTEDLLKKAVQTAATATVSIVVVGLPETLESEGYDRQNMRLPKGMDDLVTAVSQVCAHTIVILQCGSPIQMPWENNVSAILYAGLSGEAGAEATLDILEGRVNPSGHLPETWPIQAADAPCMGWWGRPHRQAQYREGVFVGYRYYQTAHQPVAHCFGEGLSYTTFSYSNLACTQKGVSFDLMNTGDRKGTEVSQVYVSAPRGGLPHPTLQLAGFARTSLGPGERRRVEIPFDTLAFNVWKDGWTTVGGTWDVKVGSNVENLPLSATLQVEGTPARLLADPRFTGTWYEHPKNKPILKDFQILYGRKIPAETHHTKGTYDKTDSLMEMGHTSAACRFMVKEITQAVQKNYDDPTDPQCRMSVLSSAGCALFGLVNCSAGSMPVWLARSLINIANGRLPWAKARNTEERF